MDLERDIQVFLFPFPYEMVRDFPQGLDPLRYQVERLKHLHHPLLLNMLSTGENDQMFFFVEEKAEGQSLAFELRRRRIKEQDFSLKETLCLAWLLCRCLNYIHDYGVHGFLNPQEIYLEPWADGPIPFYPRIAHPGIRRVFRTSPLAFAGLQKEILCYAPPEFQKPAMPQRGIDSYGIGTLLYSLLTLRPPTGCFVRPSRIRPDIPEALDRILLCAMNEDVAERFPSPQAVAQSLEELRGVETLWEETARAEKHLVEDFRIKGIVLPPPHAFNVPGSLEEPEPAPGESIQEDALLSPPFRIRNSPVYIILLILACMFLLFLVFQDVSSLNRDGGNRMKDFRKWERIFTETERQIL